MAKFVIYAGVILCSVWLSTAIKTSDLNNLITDLKATIPVATDYGPRADGVGGMLRLPFHDAFG